MPKILHVATAALLAGAAAPGLAQDMMDQAMDQSMSAMSLYAGSVPIEEDVKRSLRCERVAPLYRSPSCGGPRATRRATPKAAPPRAAPAALTYASTPDIQAQVRDAFVARVTARNAAHGRLLKAQFARHDYARVYDGLVRPYGLKGNDVGDAMTAYLLLGWTIVNGGGDPSPADLRGVRRQVGAALAHDRRLALPAQRAASGEEFKILFVTLHAGWQSALREGKLPAYAAGVAGLVRRQFGLELRGATLKDGLIVRG